MNDLIVQLGYIQYSLKKNLDGLSDDDAMRRPEPSESSLNWIIGHLIAGRNRTLQLLGKSPLWDDETVARYRIEKGTPWDSTGALPMDELMTDFENSQQQLIAGLGQASSEQLAAPAPFSPTGNDQETIGTLLAGLIFHEAYHIGQTGVLRRLLGYPGAIG